MSKVIYNFRSNSAFENDTRPNLKELVLMTNSDCVISSTRDIMIIMPNFRKCDDSA